LSAENQMGFYVYRDREGLWRWLLMTPRGTKTIAVSPEAYKRKGDCLAAVAEVIDTNRETPIDEAPSPSLLGTMGNLVYAETVTSSVSKRTSS
jgi:uncharacterized protein YegP (UPF0339 family)